MAVRLLYSGTSPTASPLAFGSGGVYSEIDLAARAGALAGAVDRVGRGRWLVFTEDSYAVAVCLVALAQTGSVAVLAPNRQPQTLRRLADGVCGAIVDPQLDTDSLDGIVRLAPLDASGDAVGEKPWSWNSPRRDVAVAEFRTSGTTGEDKGVIKTLRHLEDEVETLEELFGSRLTERTHFFSTVSHQHIYGLLFRVMWPLATGRPFHTDTLLHPQELFPRMSESGDAALVSSPVHLKRMNVGGEMARIRGECRALFSSGGPLDAQTALGISEQLGASPFEILGSTETGGVAARQRSVDGDAWRPFPGVAVEREPAGDRLAITSPFSSEGEVVDATRRRFVMGDCVEVGSDGTFTLLGRADRIVKVGEKRLSLPAMENDLEEHPRVCEAALLVMARGTEPRVHAVVALDAEGHAELRAGGRRRIGAMLGEHLAARWDRVLLPRVWRYVDELPRDPQGKLPRVRLQALFDGRRTEPIVVDQTLNATGSRIERRLEIPDDLAFLEGHFDAFPVVAGVVQLGWAVDAARALLGESWPPAGPSSLEALKFPEPLLPGQSLVVEVESTAVDRLRFRLFDGARTFATGRWRLGDPR